LGFFLWLWYNQPTHQPERKQGENLIPHTVLWQTTKYDEGGILKVGFLDPPGKSMTNHQFITQLRTSSSFRSLLTDTILASEFDGAFMEFKAMSLSLLEAPVEFVLVNSAAVSSISADFNAFSSQLEDSTTNEVRSFANLGGDATLISPCWNENQSIQSYAHLMNFLREAPTKQVQNLWQLVGNKLEERLQHGKPVWLSTSGLGVYWLHVRVCDAPKYYSYASYREAN